MKSGESPMLRRIIRQIAKDNHTTPDEVRKEMQAALDKAFNNPDKTPEMMSAQAAIPCKDEIPTLDEFILYMTRAVRDLE